MRRVSHANSTICYDLVKPNQRVEAKIEEQAEFVEWGGIRGKGL